MNPALANALRAAAVLAAFALVGAALLAATERATRPRIEANARAALAAELGRLVPPSAHDNDLVADAETRVLPGLTGTERPVTLYRATKAGRTVALVFEAVAPDGYSGEIRLLIGVGADGRLAGVRVLAHKETPGLGDFIEERRSDWIHGFDGRSLADPAPAGWAVRKDGGAFDHATGATVTPRAVIKAIRRALEHLAAHPELMRAEPMPPASKEPT